MTDPGYPYGVFDAAQWAAEFKRRFPESDEALMIGWFANAIMTGWDAAKNAEFCPCDGCSASVAAGEFAKGAAVP